MVIIKVLRGYFECCWFTEKSGRLWQWFYNSLSVRCFLLLFRKPISSLAFHISNEVIPSSNPCSQTDIEEPFSFLKNVFKEESIEDQYSKIENATEFKEQWQGRVFSNFLLSQLLNFHNFCAWSRDI